MWKRSSFISCPLLTGYGLKFTEVSQKKQEKRKSQHLDPETNSCSVLFNYVANVLTASLGLRICTA